MLNPRQEPYAVIPHVRICAGVAGDCHSCRDQLIVSLVDEHVVMLDPVTCRSLILHQVNAMDITLRGEVLLSIGSYPSVAISTLLARQSEATVQV